MYVIKEILAFLMLAILCQCSLGNDKSKHKNYIIERFSKKEKCDYDYNNPDKVKGLDWSLSEISGMAYNEAHHTLLVVNDEKGNVYELEIDNFAIISKNMFWNTGDYEGIGFDGDFIWVIKSNGKLYQYNPNSKETESFDTPISMRNEAEGLCYNEETKELFVACKGNALDKGKKSKAKAVYAFDVENKVFKEDEVLKFHPKDIIDFVEETKKGEIDKNLIGRIKVFSPSGIQISSSSSDLFVLSARGSMLLVIDLKGEIKELVFFNPKHLPQPEGICTDAEGNLYISTEGKAKKGKIFLFKKKNRENN